MGDPRGQEGEIPLTPEEAQKEFERLFGELVDLLQVTVDSMELAPAQLPSELPDKILELERQVLAFQSMGSELREEMERAEAIELKEGEYSKLTIQEQALIERSQAILKEAEEKQKNLPQDVPPQIEQTDDDEKHRRKHFKRIGRKKV